MHTKNRYGGKHDFAALLDLEPEMADYLRNAPDGHTTLDFTKARAVYLLNRTLLKRDYDLEHWDLPRGYLTPAVPGRLDYIHLLADLAPRTERVLDIGTGASVIYPILGTREYGWRFVGTDVNPKSIKVARAIVQFNPGLRGVEVRQQNDAGHIFAGVLLPGERFDLTMCNPPFHTDRPTALTAGRTKWTKLGKRDRGLTFAGHDAELTTPGGEARFLRTMIAESSICREQVKWFTCLVSQRGYLSAAHQQLEALGVVEERVLDLAQGNKQMRVLSWRW
ncbi:23S rRNA (adenine(1618)-N(6))-methyltransferase RlmF [Neolewinella sp.]|uniref:23S rRNA (adenine(1618)-N(6))-methyltransferase RlmF n=1 Tax=Neolewinella sp. TaxID=2993543 RepID=UPI003B52A9E9